VAKHAEASQVMVSLQCQDEQVELRISDDGRGFDLESIPTESLGLGIMHERAETIGAELMVESEVGQGTVITAIWKEEIQ
jgi:signal transduction histidine kinase